MAKMQLTLYAACKDGNDVLTALHNVFQKEIKEVKEENKNISFLLHTQTKIDMEVCDDEEMVRQQMEGMSNFFANVPCENKMLLQKLCIQISLFHCICAIVIDTAKEERTHVLKMIFEAAKACHGFLLYPDMCLYTADGDLLMGMDGTSGVEDFSLCGEEDALQQVSLPSAYDMEVFASIGKEFERQGWLYPNCMLNKQILFSQIHLPKKEDIGKRALALYALAWFSKLCLEDDKEQRQQFEEFKQRFSLEHCLTSQEASLLKKDTLDKQQAVELLSKFECANMLFWSLGYDGVSSWDVCDVEKMKQWILQYASFEDFLNHCAIKDEKDIYTQYVRVFYAEHFYMQSAMLYVPLSLQEDVVSERLRACKWLCDGCE